MESRFLESLIAVVDYGSISGAARHQNLTPGAVAQRIQALEEEIGAKLIERSGRRAHATEAGVQVIKNARPILQAIRELPTLITNKSISGTIRIGAIGTAMTGLLPPILKELSVSCPDLDIYIELGESKSLYRQLMARELDCGFFVQPDFKLPKACERFILRQEPLVVLAPATLDERDPHAVLARQPFIRYDRNSWGGRLADAYLQRHEIAPHERFELDALDAIAVLVDRGLGVSLVPDWQQPWPAGIKVKKLPLPDVSVTRQIGLFWMRSSPWESVIQMMIASGRGG
ncbi:LysR substrate-binding domain-containing protein [Agaricicola taiwanensis]|nr:LysR substrate-binding domain-containing protein [Agaricicola taiwanensis]